MKSRFTFNHLIIFLCVLVLVLAHAGASTTKPSAPKLQVLFRGDEQTGVWNVYIFGAECRGGRLTLHEPTDYDQPMRIECVEHR